MFNEWARTLSSVGILFPSGGIARHPNDCVDPQDRNSACGKRVRADINCTMA